MVWLLWVNREVLKGRLGIMLTAAGKSNVRKGSGVREFREFPEIPGEELRNPRLFHPADWSLD